MVVHVIPDISENTVVKSTDADIPQPDIFTEREDLRCQINSGKRPRSDQRFNIIELLCETI